MASSFAISTRRRPESQPRRSPTRLSGWLCFIPPAPPAGRRAFCVRCQTSRRPSTSRSFDFFKKTWRFREGTIHLQPAPIYHAAPLAAVTLTIHTGGTAIIMEHFDPEQFLALVERYRATHTMFVPTMFSRMLKLPEETRPRYDLSSLETAIHGAAPCPPQIKEQMIEWWGPIIYEYYSATEGLCLVFCNSDEWLAHRG